MFTQGEIFENRNYLFRIFSQSLYKKYIFGKIPQGHNSFNKKIRDVLFKKDQKKQVLFL